MSIFGGHFLALFQCDDCILKSTTAWLLKLSVLYIHSFMQVHNTTFYIKTVFNNVLFSSEVHNPLHAHLLARSHVYIYIGELIWSNCIIVCVQVAASCCIYNLHEIFGCCYDYRSNTCLPVCLVQVVHIYLGVMVSVSSACYSECE